MSYEMNAEGVNGVNSITIIQANDWPVLAGDLILQVNAGPGLGGPASWDPLIQGVAGVQSIGYGNSPGLIGQGGANQGPGVVGIGGDPNWELPQSGFPLRAFWDWRIRRRRSDRPSRRWDRRRRAGFWQWYLLGCRWVRRGQCRYGCVWSRRRDGWPRSSGYRRWWSEYKPISQRGWCVRSSWGAATLTVCKAGAAEASRVWRDLATRRMTSARAFSASAEGRTVQEFGVLLGPHRTNNHRPDQELVFTETATLVLSGKS